MASGREPVEIKTTVGGFGETMAVESALDSLTLGNSPANRHIWFLEDTSPGIGHGARLLDVGIVLRLRRGLKGESDSTVKLRPCRRSQLVKGWTGSSRANHIEFRIEQDWVGQHRTLAASCVAKIGSRRLGRILDGDAKVSDAFEAPQLIFLAKCGDLRVNVAGLTMLGPIAAAKWDRIVIDGAVAERWTVGALDFLEISVRARDVGDAIKEQAAFQESIADLGIQMGGNRETKTKRVLTYLMQGQEQDPANPT